MTCLCQVFPTVLASIDDWCVSCCWTLKCNNSYYYKPEWAELIFWRDSLGKRLGKWLKNGRNSLCQLFFGFKLGMGKFLIVVDLESEGVYDALRYILPVWSPFCLSLLSSTSPPATSSMRDLLLVTVVFHLSAWTCPARRCFLPRFPYFTWSLGSSLLKLMTTLTHYMTVHSRLMHRQCVLWTGDVI